MISTKRGDGGMSEYFGRKVSKGGRVLEALGTLDELQAVIQLVNYQLRIKNLNIVVEDLYLIMGRKLTIERIKWLEEEIINLEKNVKINNKFVIFKKEKGIKLNWVRTIVRRAERRSIFFKDRDILIYLNRLSDFIYLLALKKEV